MFHDAMLTSGVGIRRAWLMYKAVATFGPTWPEARIAPECQVVTERYDFEKCARNFQKPPISYPAIYSADLLRFADQIEGEADLEDIEKLRSTIKTVSP